MSWIDIGSLNDVPRCGTRTLETPEGQIAVFRTSDDAVFALVNCCPHQGGPLSEGIIFGHVVACPLHNWIIDLESGKAVPPDEGYVPCKRIRVEKGRLWLEHIPD